MTISPISDVDPATARQLLAGGARLIDVRSADEHARSHIHGAINVPLDVLASTPMPDGPLVFHCKSGMRTKANAAALADAAGGAAYVLKGGIDGWTKSGLPVEVDRAKPIEIMRQVQIAAGILVLTGVALGLLVSPGFFRAFGLCRRRPDIRRGNRLVRDGKAFGRYAVEPRGGQLR